MRNSYGQNIKYTIFGQSHSLAIGITIDGLKSGVNIDFDKVNEELLKRQGKLSFNTPRQEKVEYEIVSGYFNNKTTGTSLTVLFYNKDTKSKDYSNLVNHPRPGHADFTAKIKYNNSHDYRGGGAFSGRMTTLIVFAGAIIKQFIEHEYPKLKIYSHIKSVKNIKDLNYYKIRSEIVDDLFKIHNVNKVNDLINLDTNTQKSFAKEIKAKLLERLSILENKIVLNDDFEQTFYDLAQQAKDKFDTLGGSIESIIINCPIGVGEPFFSSVESEISKLLYSIPSIKGVAFGNYESFIMNEGSIVKDEFLYLEDKQAYTLLNNNGGINGGITNGEDIIVSSIIKPIPSLLAKQQTYSFAENKIETLQINGRHDSTVINRIIPVINAMLYIGIYDLIIEAKKYE